MKKIKLQKNGGDENAEEGGVRLSWKVKLMWNWRFYGGNLYHEKVRVCLCVWIERDTESHGITITVLTIE